ncbi:bifunctional 2-polyprenyl-6-hydroxyphenol methylase/3-demethylubiquinol 3-O-methyltransferase UbiG [Shewanella sp. YLB-07]|uniref:bifunctional 2-polyprenyl-6-hydroxyphenol methylase/3-demethylubiquinol 3-O-methyltransferase UbiG n=1 Tax=Shewanella sp. YLB-07 TaxID=2601268 RepID=UPI0012C81FB6|nr:bifunctional 2-polyprenyl-6-hydroxyphenol methylase/3-demethylubiquinol 3-O-methyltransferase UbiG [Shewanella sp. YLB-07]MPY26346.1 bifunctional 2-polyprenyl-6-hydroxyphenol methylase/3-demethylubiquinol 3-O-methyltransferase UbiG [Shewanella sp. YLB-07]
MLDRSKLTCSHSTGLDTAKEIAKFDRLAEEWRDPKGKFKQVLAFNQTRLIAIEKMIAQHLARDLNNPDPLAGLSLLDIGCGAGLLCEPLAELGADVTGIDASENNILVASQHAKKNYISVNYIHCLASDLEDKAETNRYDIVLNTEVIEHVADQQGLIDTCCKLLKPGGLLVMATLNRTITSYIVGIIGAEYVMRYLPIGTHEWRYFVKPQEISAMLSKQGLETINVTGMTFNPFTKHWSVNQNTRVNYLLFAAKPSDISSV